FNLALYNHLLFVFHFIDFFDCTVDFTDDSLPFRITRFKQFLDTWQTLSDVVTSNTTGMECTHCELCTRLTDRLSGYDTDSLTNFDFIACSQVSAITFLTDTVFGITCESTSD